MADVVKVIPSSISSFRHLQKSITRNRSAGLVGKEPKLLGREAFVFSSFFNLVPFTSCPNHIRKILPMAQGGVLKKPKSRLRPGMLERSRGRDGGRSRSGQCVHKTIKAGIEFINMLPMNVQIVDICVQKGYKLTFVIPIHMFS